MAKSNQPKSTDPIDIGPPESAGVMAAWQGLYHAFGARLASYDVTEDGIVLRGVTFNEGTNVERLIKDVNTKGRRVALFPTISWLNGQEPAQFATAQEMTVFGVQNFRGSDPNGDTRTPKYVRDAFATLKQSLGIAGRRGPKPRTINLKNLKDLNANTLKAAGVSTEDLQRLIDIAQEVADSQAAANVAETADA